MKFLIDAQLPAARLADHLKGAGHEAVHTNELPDGNRATDNQVAQRADADGRVVVTKDQDFRAGHLLAGFAASAAPVPDVRRISLGRSRPAVVGSGRARPS